MNILKAKQTITKKTRRKSSKRSKRKKNLHEPPSTSIDCLPSEMISEVLARVAASSPIDLFRCKLSCKSLQKISDEKEVLQQVSLGTFCRRGVWLSEKASTFFMKCLECNNPEALLRFGFVQYFTHMVQEGIKNMEKAAELKNKDAAYVLGLIYICSGEEEYMKRGFKLLMNTGRVIGGKGIVECRKNLRDMRYSSWMNNKVVTEKKPKISCGREHKHEKIMSNWDKSDYYGHEIDEDSLVCETCKCAREVDFFYKLMHVV